LPHSQREHRLLAGKNTEGITDNGGMESVIFFVKLVDGKF
jgi:hypothetical protein